MIKIDGNKYLVTLDEEIMMPDGLMYKCLWGTLYIHNFNESFSFPAKGHANYFYTIGSREAKEGTPAIAGCRVNHMIRMDNQPVILKTNRVMVIAPNGMMEIPFYYDNIYIVKDEYEPPTTN